MKFEVTITQTASTTIDVEASNADEALSIAEDIFYDGGLDLDDNNETLFEIRK